MKRKSIYWMVFVCALFFILVAIGFKVYKLNIFSQNNNNGAQSKDTNISSNLKIPQISGLQGGYIPKNKIIIGDFKLTTLLINTTFDNKIESIQFYITDKEQKVSAEFFTCKDYKIELDKIILNTTPTKIGDIFFEGNFLPVKNGTYMYLYGDNVVLKGKLVIKNNGKKIYTNNQQEFIFFYGD